MKKTALAAVLAIAALSASACTGGTSTPSAAETPADSAPIAHESTPAPSAAPASSAPASSAAPLPGMTSPNDERQAYADGAMQRWLSSQGAHSLKGFTSPFNLITDWASPDSDTLALVVDDEVEDFAAHNGGDVIADLREIGAALIVAVNAGNLQVTKVVVATGDGEHKTTVRYDEPPVTVS